MLFSISLMNPEKHTEDLTSHHISVCILELHVTAVNELMTVCDMFRLTGAHIYSVSPPGAFPALRHHLPVQHPRVRQISEEISIRPAHVQRPVRVIHR